MTLRVLALTRYGALGASTRMRCMQYIPALVGAGFQIQVQALFDDAALAARYERGAYSFGTAMQCFVQRIAALRNRKLFDVLWIEKEALPWWPQWVESALLRGVPYVLDFDDAVFHNYDQHRFALVRHFFGKRLDGLMAQSALVVAGNDYLVQRARDAGASWVEVLPTVIDLDRYPYPHPAQLNRTSVPPVVVWISSPSTVRYLQLLQEPLQSLAQRMPFVLRVIGGEVAFPGVQVECLPWTENTEVAHIANADVGVMPLLDSPWERGKCGYKLIQYMACGLPVVASPVGVNASIVRDGVNGFWSHDAQSWACALEKLLTDASLRERMGAEGRQKVERDYCLQVTAPRLAVWLNKVALKR